MAYMNQTRKAQLAPGIKQVLAKYKVKGTISTDRHALTVTIKSSPLDFFSDYNKTVGERYPDNYRGSPVKDHLQVNEYWYQDHFSNRKNQAFLKELIQAMNVGNHDNSDIQSDYFDVGWYTHINIGKWNKPYEVTR